MAEWASRICESNVGRLRRRCRAAVSKKSLRPGWGLKIERMKTANGQRILFGTLRTRKHTDGTFSILFAMGILLSQLVGLLGGVEEKALSCRAAVE